MPNQTQIECYFKSSEIAKLCKDGEDIVINFSAEYHAGKAPKFSITASSLKGKAKGLLTDGGTTSGCPTPCR